MGKLVKINRKGCIVLAVSSVTTLVVFGLQKMTTAGSWLIALGVVALCTMFILFLEGERTAKIIKFAEDGNIPEVKKLLDKPKTRNAINEMGANGNRLLHYASGDWKEPDLVEKIIQLGADVDIKNIWKKTPLHAAAEANNVDAIRILLTHGADIHSLDIYQVTPLDIVKKKNRKRTLTLVDEFLTSSRR